MAEKLKNYLNEKLELTPRQIIKTHGKDILKYYMGKSHQLHGSDIDNLAVMIIEYLKKIGEKESHLSNEELKDMAKKIIHQYKEY